MDSETYKSLHNYRDYLEQKLCKVENDDTIIGEYKRGLLAGYRSAYLTLMNRFPALNCNDNDPA